MKAIVYVILLATITVLGFSGAAADVDDQTQVAMLTNYLLTGSFSLPSQPQMQRVAVYNNYALVELNVPLPQPQAQSASTPAAATSPLGGATTTTSPVASPAASPSVSATAAPASGPSSFVAFKTHRNWLYQFSKTGRYNQTDLVAAGVPKDVAAFLIVLLKPPHPLPSP